MRQRFFCSTKRMWLVPCVMVTQEGHATVAGQVQGAGDACTRADRAASIGRVGANRLAMLLAVLHRHAGVACFDQDVS